MASGNATAAAIEAGYNKNAAPAQGGRLKKKLAPQISDAQSALTKRTLVTLDRMVARLSDIAYTDITDICEWDEEGVVTFTASKDIPDAAKAAIVSVEAEATKHGQKIRLKVESKTHALELIAKLLGFLRDRLEITGANVDPVTIYIPDNGRGSPVKGGNDGEGKVEAGEEAESGAAEGDDSAGQAGDGDTREAQGT